MIISEYPNSSLWDMDYERLLHSKKTLPETVGSYKPSSPFRSSSLLSYHRSRSLLSQNQGQKPQEKHLSCEVCLEFFRYGLMDTLGPSLAWNLSWFYSCDQEVNLPKIHISALKVFSRSCCTSCSSSSPQEYGCAVSSPAAQGLPSAPEAND